MKPLPIESRRKVPMIGPNAIIQTVKALDRFHGPGDAELLLARSQSGITVSALPSALIEENTFARFAGSIVERYGDAAARGVFEESGRLTADYVLANRLPGFAKAVISVAPKALGTWMLLRAIGANASTFGESGTYAFSMRRQTRIRVANPAFALVPSVCSYHRGAFTRLLQALIDPDLRLRKETCERAGSPCCTFLVYKGNADVQ